MDWKNAASHGYLTAATAAAIFIAAIIPRFRTEYPPLFDDLICWTLVIAIVGFPLRANNRIWKTHSVSSTTPLTRLYWIAASSIAVTSAFSFFVDTIWIVPVVAYALLAHRPTVIFTRLHASIPGYTRYTRVVIALGIVIFASLVPILDAKRLAAAVLVALGLIGTYTSLIRISGRDHDYIDGREQLETQSFVNSVASRVQGMLILLAGMILIIWPVSTPDMSTTVLTGSLKAAYWVIIFWLTQEIPWEIVPTIGAYVAASTGSAHPTAPGLSSILQVSTRAIISLLSLHQTVDFLPRNERGRTLLAVFALWPILSFLQHVHLKTHTITLPDVSWYQPLTHSSNHPVELLIRKAQEDFRRLVDQQSKTLQSAEIEYRKRYSRDPPPGFDKWFSYARSKNSVLIDDFDMITEDLKPFWKIAPEHLRESIDFVASLEHLALGKCGFTNGQYYGQGGGWISASLGNLLAEVAKDIPDVDFAVNVVDEPRVIITQQMLDAGGVSKPEFQDARHLSIWDRVNSSCARTKSIEKATPVYDYGLSLVQDWKHAKDLCSHPDFGLTHGFFSSPMTSLLTDAAIPVLSQAAPTSFGDIVCPSPWYTEKMGQGDYKDDQDPLWEKKTKKLYWAGSTTGSYGWNGTWQYSHRQRFVNLVQTLNHTEHMYLNESTPGQWTSYQATEDHSNLFDVKFTAIIQCEKRDCEEQRKFFTLGEKEARDRQYQFQFVFDMDGNSFSGRFYTLLRSRSAVLKQTAMREWHDERLIPWVHFIPISMSMDELPEIMRYMTSHEEGKGRAREIAEAGRKWYHKVLRREDFTIYLYRLMLELARIMDPARHIEK